MHDAPGISAASLDGDDKPPILAFRYLAGCDSEPSIKLPTVVDRIGILSGKKLQQEVEPGNASSRQRANLVDDLCFVFGDRFNISSHDPSELAYMRAKIYLQRYIYKLS